MPNSDGQSFGGDNNHFFSFNIGPVHIISFSTEFYYFIEYGIEQVKSQYDWLEQDLIVLEFFHLILILYFKIFFIK